MSVEVCPHCNADLRSDPIPEKDQHLFGNKTHFSRIIGLEDSRKYDGVSYWMCPDCRVIWDRFTGKIQTPGLINDYPALAERFENE
jgi:hypothetical protein